MPPTAGRHTTKIAFFAIKRPRRPGMIAIYFKSLRGQIRYLANQWNYNGFFAPINELKPP
jgi:hypothetical protein